MNWVLTLQIRKQQKEHAELIEEYRIKQQQCGIGPHAVVPGIASQPPLVPGGSPPAALGQQNFPMVPQQLQHPVIIPGQHNPPRMPNLPGWQTASAAPAHLPHSAPRMPPTMAQLPVNPVTPTSASTPGSNVQAGPPPRVEFDDNNPFSESFQERERKERLREQQERQRIQLMQEVDRQRALQQRMEMEQHGPMSSELSARTSLSQIPFFNSDLPCDFMRPPQPLQQSPQQPVLPQGPLNSPPAAGFPLCNEQQPVGVSPFGPEPPPVPEDNPTFHTVKQSHGKVSGTSFTQYQARTQFATGQPAVSSVSGSGAPCGQDSSLPHGANFPGANQSLIQLYSDIVPEEKGKKKRTRKKKEEDVESVNTPPTPHSDTTAPLTPVVSESSSTPIVSTPGELSRQPMETETEDLPASSTPNPVESQSSLELKGQTSNTDLPKNKLPEQSSINSKTDEVKPDVSGNIQEIRQEKTETDECPSQAEPKLKNQSVIKVEEDKTAAYPSPSSESQAQPSSVPAAKGDSGNELLKHLLKNKKSASLLNQKSDVRLQPEERAEEGRFMEKQDPVEGGMVSSFCN